MCERQQLEHRPQADPCHTKCSAARPSRRGSANRENPRRRNRSRRRRPVSMLHEGSFYFARLLPKNAPIRAVMIDGTESTPNTTTPSGKRLPDPWVNSIQENWPTRGATPHRHGLLGSIKPSTADTIQTTGMLIRKYHWESHASLLPEALDTTTHTTIPVTTANP